MIAPYLTGVLGLCEGTLEAEAEVRNINDESKTMFNEDPGLHCTEYGQMKGLSGSRHRLPSDCRREMLCLSSWAQNGFQSSKAYKPGAYISTSYLGGDSTLIRTQGLVAFLCGGVPIYVTLRKCSIFYQSLLAYKENREDLITGQDVL